MQLTPVFKKFPEGYAAFVEEFPGPNAQAKMLDAARRNLVEAVQLVLESNRRMSEESLGGEDVIREPLALPSV